METAKKSGLFQVALVGLLSLNFGIVFFDRNAFGFLTTYIDDDIPMTNTQIGWVGAGMSITWALSALAMSAVSDRTGRRKAFLIGATVIFSLCSFLTGWSQTFAMLLGARLLMGAAEGGILPMSQAVIAESVSDKWRGVAMGGAQTLGAGILGTFAAAAILTRLAEAFGWREAFYMAGVPGLVCAALIALMVKETPRPAKAANAERVPLGRVLGERNIWVCTGIAILLVAAMLIVFNLMPRYLVEARGFSGPTMGGLLSMLGLAAAAFGITVPALSDRIGRKPVMVIVPLFGVLIPLAAMYGGSDVIMIGGAFFIGWAFAATFTLFMSIVPSESVPPAYLATSMAFVIAVGEIVGGVAGPLLAGAAADRFGIGIINWIFGALCLMGAALALLLRETAPAVAAKRGAAPLTATV